MEGRPCRSWLFVPGDSEKKQHKASTSAADVLIFDLEDSVAPNAKEAARNTVCSALAKPQKPAARCVRVNPVSSDLCEADIRGVMPGHPDCIMLPKLMNVDELERVEQWLCIAEQEHGIEPGITRLIPLVTEVPQMILRLNGILRWPNRVIGVTWGAEDLAAELGASTNRNDNGQWRAPYEHARTMTLFSAKATQVLALDTVYTDFGNMAGLSAYAQTASEDGFDGMLAIHPNQIEPINTAFTPTADEVAEAKAVMAAFAATPGAGVVRIGARMYDEPHRRQAARVLARAGVA